MTMKKDDIRKDGETLSTPASSEDSAAVVPKRRRFGRKFLFRILCIVSVIFIMISFTVSWYHESDTATASAGDIKSADANNLRDESGKEPYVMGTLTPLVGDGIKFFSPVFEKQMTGSVGDFNSYKNVLVGLEPLDEDVTKPVASDVKSVFIEDFTFKIEGEFDIYLDGGSKIEPLPEYEEGSEDYKAIYKKYQYIDSVARVAICQLNEESEVYELRAVWIPSVKDKNGVLEEFFEVVYADENSGEAVTKKVWTNGAASGNAEVNGVSYYWGSLYGENNMNLGKMANSVTYRCIIWLDGKDVDCSNELADLRIKATFNFTSVGKVLETETEGEENL